MELVQMAKTKLLTQQRLRPLRNKIVPKLFGNAHWLRQHDLLNGCWEKLRLVRHAVQFDSQTVLRHHLTIPQISTMFANPLNAQTSGLTLVSIFLVSSVGQMLRVRVFNPFAMESILVKWTQALHGGPNPCAVD